MSQLDLFISYSSRDTTAAESIARQAKQRGLQVFLAIQTLVPGERWDEAIRLALLECRELCVLVTPESLKSEWVTAEWNAAWLLKKRLTPILKGIDIKELPKRLLEYQVADYYRVDEFIDQVVQRKLEDPLLVYSEFKSHNLVKETLLAPTIENSPFVFDELIKLTKKRIFIAGQNLYTLIVRNGKKNKEILFEFLTEDNARSVDIMLCDPGFDAGIKTWQKITASLEYEEDLRNSISMLEEWTIEAKTYSLQFRARRSPIVPLSVTFVDPDDKSGKLFLTPNVYQNNPGERSCFLLDRFLHERAFMFYWTNYELNYLRGSPIGQSD